MVVKAGCREDLGGNAQGLCGAGDGRKSTGASWLVTETGGGRSRESQLLPSYSQLLPSAAGPG